MGNAIRTVDKLAAFFGCNTDWLATGEGVAQPSSEVARLAIMDQLQSGPADAAKSMDVPELIREIQHNVQLLAQERAPYLRGAYAKIVADFAKELQRKTGWNEVEQRAEGTK
jgi:hypothetical protein